MIEVNNLRKKYTSATGEVIAVDDVSLTLGDTGLVFILGKSGSGKTSLLNLMAGLDQADRGSVQALFLPNYGVSETDVLKLSVDQLDIYHNLCMGFVFQDNCLIDNWAVKDNVAISLLQQESSSFVKDPEEQITRILEYVDMAGLMNRRVSELSAGQVQRIAIARALIKNPNVIFADEPTGNLDVKSSRIIFNLLKKISQNCLVVVVTHDENSAYAYGDRIIKMSDGKIIDDGLQSRADDKFELFARCLDDLETESSITGNLENVRIFLCERLLDNIGREQIFRLEARKKVVQENKTIDNTNVRSKNMPFISIAYYVFLNLKDRMARLSIAIFILSISLLFFQVAGHLCFADVGKPISEYLISNGVNGIFLREEVSYYDEYKESHYINCGDSDRVIAYIDSNCKPGQAVGCISQAEVSYGDNAISALLCTQTWECELLEGTLPQNGNEICITDYVAAMLNLDDHFTNVCVSIFDTDFYVCGIINTDYEETQLLARTKMGKQTEMDMHNIEYAYTKILCNEGFMDFLCDSAKHVSVTASDFTKRGEEAYLASSLKFASIKSIDGISRLYGRQPKAVNEILVSLDFAVDHNLLADDEFVGERQYYLRDIQSASYNGAYDGAINMYDILPDVLVVGVAVAENDVDVWVADEVFNTIKMEFYSVKLIDIYQINIHGEHQSDLSKFVTKMYDQGFYVDEPNIVRISQLYELRNQFKAVVAILLIVFFVLTILLSIMFITYYIKDNRRRIGILMALGMGRVSIAKIYMCESLFISALSYVVSLGLSGTVFGVINNYFSKIYELDISIFAQSIWVQFGAFAFILCLGVATVCYPIISMSKERPIKLIKD